MEKGNWGHNIVGKMIVYAVMNITVGSLEALAPKVLDSLKRKGLDVRQLAKLRYYIKTAAGRMIDRGLIKIEKTAGGKKYFALTEKGKAQFAQYRLGELKIKKPQLWDGNWRVIIFDIKELNRRLRYRLRRQLIALGFRRLQRSVWVFPYECEEAVLLLKTGFGLGKDVIYMEVAYLENDRWLRREFGFLK